MLCLKHLGAFSFASWVFGECTSPSNPPELGMCSGLCFLKTERKLPMKLQMAKSNVKKTLQEGFEEFLRYCKVRNLSDDTFINHKNSMKYFQAFYGSSGVLRDIRRSTIDEYIIWFRESHRASGMTLAMHLKNIKAVFNYCAKLGYMDKIEMPVIRYERKVKDTYSDAELALLLKKPDLHKCDFSTYRSWVIINYLLATGNRLSTVSNLKIGDIDFDGQTIKITKVKNKKQQYLPLSHMLSQILMEYLQFRNGNAEDYLFCSVYGLPMTKSCMTNSIRRYNHMRGVSKTSIHLFRHTFAKKWILAGGDIFRLQKMLGHSSIDVVKEYVTMFSNDMYQDFSKFNALDQLSIQKDYISMKS
jgi:integrase/recombinase XerD